MRPVVFGLWAQMLMPEGVRVGPAHLLWLATGAGAAALGLGHEVGDLTPGKSADLVLVAPPAGRPSQPRSVS